MDAINELIMTLIEKGVPFSVNGNEYYPEPTTEDDFDYARAMHEEHQIDILASA